MDPTLITLTLLPLLAGWVADMILGDPPSLPHPVVGMGKMISFCEHRLNRGRRRVMKGAFTAVGLIAVVYIASFFALRYLSEWPWLCCAVEAVCVFFCLAGTTLVREVRMVFEAADRSIEAGRRQVGRIVGRDTASLSDREVRTAALETLAENLSDGVVAPLFWFAVLGVPGMLAYKMINTLDSMIGYRSDRFRDFGRWAARIDDAANWIPARLTAALMAIVGGGADVWRSIRRYGRSHASPNSGYPEAALAGILKCRFGGTHDYFGVPVVKPYIGECERELTSADVAKAVSVNRRVEILAVILAGAVALARVCVL